MICVRHARSGFSWALGKSIIFLLVLPLFRIFSLSDEDKNIGELSFVLDDSKK